MGIASVAFLFGLIMFKWYDGREKQARAEAINRLNSAFDSQYVELPIIGKDGTKIGTKQVTIDEYLDKYADPNVERADDIRININIADRVSKLNSDDLVVAGTEKLSKLTDDLWGKVETVYANATKLHIEAHNADALNQLKGIEDYKSKREISFHIDRFLRTDSKKLELITEYGELFINSDFFYEYDSRTGKTSPSVSETDYLYFSIDEANERLMIQLRSETDEERRLDNPSKSLLVKIPLSIDFMKSGDNLPRWNAVRYIENDGAKSGIIPRSFIDGEYLYIFTSCTGTFELIRTSNPITTDPLSFLADRGILINDVGGENNERWVTRKEFFQAIMQINWMESRYYETSDIVPFPDITGDKTLILKYNAAQALGIVIGFPPMSENDVNGFRPNLAITRRDMFILINSYIEKFGINVNRVMPKDDTVRRLLNDESNPADGRQYYWYDAVVSLENMGFIHYRLVDGNKTLALDDYATADECREILYKLVSSDQF